MSRAYYNEIDRAAVAVLTELITTNVIAPGDVDSRSIKDVTANDLRGYTQCHFFAGGGLWSVAARLAGWPDSRPLWTGSCPCQPFSAAGKGLGTDDARHLWPDFHRLISAARPPVIMGEQVAGAAGYGWFDGVRSDLAREAYAGRAVDIPACAIDAPHQRNRLYWLAVDDRSCEGRPVRSITEIERGNLWRERAPFAASDVGADECRSYLQSDATAQRDGREPRELPTQEVSGIREVPGQGHRGIEPRSLDSNIQSHADSCGRNGRSEIAKRFKEQRTASEWPYARNGSWWADAEWIVSPLDGKARRTKPSLPFLVDGLPGRVDLWRIGGNAISPILAAEVIAAFLDAEHYSLSQHQRGDQS